MSPPSLDSDKGVTEMRKVVAYELLSLDGVAEAPNEFFTDWDDVMDNNLARVISTQDTVLLGRRTYDEWSEYWPPSDIEPFASFINQVEKFVASSDKPKKLWTNSTMIEGDFQKFVTELKETPGGDIGVHGSITLCQSLIEAGVVDELRLVIAPSFQGSGRKLLNGGLPTRLKLTNQIASPTGYVLLDYQIITRSIN
jgi:dihydrofolate reductase